MLTLGLYLPFWFLISKQTHHFSSQLCSSEESSGFLPCARKITAITNGASPGHSPPGRRGAWPNGCHTVHTHTKVRRVLRGTGLASPGTMPATTAAGGHDAFGSHEAENWGQMLVVPLGLKPVCSPVGTLMHCKKEAHAPLCTSLVWEGISRLG